jgi:DNA-directed RNA polymerase specialized sigma24 family protein
MRHVRPASSTGAAESVLDFDTFFATEYQRLFEVLYLLTRDRAEAEDLAQEAMARVYERWSGIRDPSRYVYRTAFNLHRTLRRRLAVVVRSGASYCRPPATLTRWSGAWTPWPPWPCCRPPSGPRWSWWTGLG